MKRRKKKRKYEHFVLNWNICCIEDFDAAVEIFEDWAETGEYTGVSCTVKEIICSVDAELYERLSRGDKCRVGKFISNRFQAGCYSEICRGENKGVTKTYRVK